MDDRGYNDYQRRRLGIGYINPYFSLFQTALVGIYLLTWDLDGTDLPSHGLRPGHYTLISHLFPGTVGALVVFAFSRGFVYATSTIYGSVYRNRTALPPALGMLLLVNSLRVRNPHIKMLSHLAPASEPALTLTVINIVLVAWWLLRTKYSRIAQWNYFDTRFSVHPNGECLYLLSGFPAVKDFLF